MATMMSRQSSSSNELGTHSLVAHEVLERRIRCCENMDDWVFYTTGQLPDGQFEARQLMTRPLDSWLRTQIQRVAKCHRASHQTLRGPSYEIAMLDNRGPWAPLPICVTFFFTRYVELPPTLSWHPDATWQVPALDAAMAESADGVRVVCVIDRLHFETSAPPLSTWGVAAALAMRLPRSA